MRRRHVAVDLHLILKKSLTIKMKLKVIILAAGKGKRMGSDLPKVLHRLGEKSLLEHVVETAYPLDYAKHPIVVYGYQGALVQQRMQHLPVTWVEQTEQLGTGHALKQTIQHVVDATHVLVLYGDIPLTSSKTLRQFIHQTPADALGIITAYLPNPMGYGGRILRDEDNRVNCVIEEKDATEIQLTIKEINSGFYIIPVKYLNRWLSAIENHNSQREYYLTDIIQLAYKDNVTIHTTHPECYEEILGINDLSQLAKLEAFYLQH